MGNTLFRPARTVGHLAASCGVKVHQVQYVVATRDHIRPVALAGRVRLFDAKAAAQIRYELNLIAAKRGASK